MNQKLRSHLLAAMTAMAAMITMAITGPLIARQDSAAPATQAPPQLTMDSLPHWLEVIRPHADEQRWLEIPWRESFWQGVLDAQRERKPVLLWAMNGHPMGCT